MRRKLGRSELARTVHFRKAGPTEKQGRQRRKARRQKDRLEEQLIGASEVPTEQIGLLVLDRLREVDHVAYVRFASVYKGFDDAADFERELTLLTKATAPKQH